LWDEERFRHQAKLILQKNQHLGCTQKSKHLNGLEFGFLKPEEKKAQKNLA
jgi:hypothetical protein